MCLLKSINFKDKISCPHVLLEKKKYKNEKQKKWYHLSSFNLPSHPYRCANRSESATRIVGGVLGGFFEAGIIRQNYVTPLGQTSSEVAKKND